MGDENTIHILDWTRAITTGAHLGWKSTAVFVSISEESVAVIKFGTCGIHASGIQNCRAKII